MYLSPFIFIILTHIHPYQKDILGMIPSTQIIMSQLIEELHGMFPGKDWSMRFSLILCLLSMWPSLSNKLPHSTFNYPQKYFLVQYAPESRPRLLSSRSSVYGYVHLSIRSQVNGSFNSKRFCLLVNVFGYYSLYGFVYSSTRFLNSSTWFCLLKNDFVY